MFPGFIFIGGEVALSALDSRSTVGGCCVEFSAELLYCYGASQPQPAAA